MKVVLDTNVIVSGLLSPYSAAGEIVRMAAGGIITLCYDARIITEYREVLQRPKFCFSKNHIYSLLDEIETCGYAICARPLALKLPDLDDEPFLEVAIVAEAVCLVTGNLKHYPAKVRQDALVLSPAQFLEKFFRS
ncbi:MAG: putative toxin-antitoxin system toxin component, PIN family [Candidatus Omnitrophota bacterium]